MQIGIVDDNDRISGQIAEKLLLTDEVDILFMAGSGREALQWLAKHRTRPAVILMDIEMPEMNGIEATFRICSVHPEIKIVMLTVFDDEANIFKAIKAGATGYLLKDEEVSRMLNACNDACSGGAPMSPPIAKKALQMLTSGYKAEKQLLYTEDQEELSKREIDVLEQMAEGRNSDAIASALFISTLTVKKHIENIYRKLHIRSRVELLLWYKQA